MSTVMRFHVPANVFLLGNLNVGWALPTINFLSLFSKITFSNQINLLPPIRGVDIVLNKFVEC